MGRKTKKADTVASEISNGIVSKPKKREATTSIAGGASKKAKHKETTPVPKQENTTGKIVEDKQKTIKGKSKAAPIADKSPAKKRKTSKRNANLDVQSSAKAKTKIDAASKKGKNTKMEAVNGKVSEVLSTGKDSGGAGSDIMVSDKIKEAVERAKRTGKYVGAHTSIAGGLENAVLGAVEIGARVFAMFLKSQRQWVSKPMTDEAAQCFKAAMEKYNFSPDMVVPHGSYLMNCGSPKTENLEKSRAMLVEELQRCEALGLTIFNFHPGSTCGDISIDECISKIADSINAALASTKYVTAVVENMSCQGNTIGGRFEELRDIISQVTNKSRVGVCLDTCHAFAAGFDLSTEEGYNSMIEEFDSIVGLKYLKAIHLNDSKGKVGCHLDRHENIGRGHIGKEGFQRVMNDPRLNGLPMILETPASENYGKEVNLLYQLCTDAKKPDF